jgi:hypothetical protein
MSGKRIEIGFRRELIDINREFLRLATDPAVGGIPSLLGLPATTLANLRALSPLELDAVAETPLLLVEFHPLPGLSSYDSIADSPPFPPDLPANWRREAEGFANRLLACIWQATRQDRLLTTFCIGIDTERHRKLADLSFGRISQNSATALRSLRVRLADHPSFWNDLVHSIRSGNPTQQNASRLAMIPLTIASSGLPTSTSECPRYF